MLKEAMDEYKRVKSTRYQMKSNNSIEKLSHEQCDQSGQFPKVLGVKFYYKSSPNILRLSELFEEGYV